MNEIFYEMEESFNNFMIETENFIKINLKDKYIEKDKVRNKIKDIKYRCSLCELKEVLECEKGAKYCGNRIALDLLEELLEE